MPLVEVALDSFKKKIREWLEKVRIDVRAVWLMSGIDVRNVLRKTVLLGTDKILRNG